jgi:hypothetical protein
MNDDPQKRPAGKIVPKKEIAPLSPPKGLGLKAGGPSPPGSKRERIRIELPFKMPAPENRITGD